MATAHHRPLPAQFPVRARPVSPPDNTHAHLVTNPAPATQAHRSRLVGAGGGGLRSSHCTHQCDHQFLWRSRAPFSRNAPCSAQARKRAILDKDYNLQGRKLLVELFRPPAHSIYGQRGLPLSRDDIFGASSVRVELPRSSPVSDPFATTLCPDRGTAEHPCTPSRVPRASQAPMHRIQHPLCPGGSTPGP